MKYQILLFFVCGAHAFDAYYSVPVTVAKVDPSGLVPARFQQLRATMSDKNVMRICGREHDDEEKLIDTAFLQEHIPEIVAYLQQYIHVGKNCVSTQQNGSICALMSPQRVQVLNMDRKELVFTIANDFRLPSVETMMGSAKPDMIASEFTDVAVSPDGQHLATLARLKAYYKLRVFKADDGTMIDESFGDIRYDSDFKPSNIRLWWSPDNTLTLYYLAGFRFYSPDQKIRLDVPMRLAGDSIENCASMADATAVAYKLFGSPQVIMPQTDVTGTTITGHRRELVDDDHLLPNPLALRRLSVQQKVILDLCSRGWTVSQAEVSVLPLSLQKYLIARGAVTA